VIEKVLARIRPGPEEEARVRETASSLVEAVREEVARRGVRGEVLLVGSVAKGTFLRDPDMDVFIRFPLDVSREEMERTALEIGKAVLHDWVISYAEHPYVRGVYRGYEADIVPCYSIRDPSELKSSVDRTPFHTEYVRRHLPVERRDDVRLLKAFMRGIGVYGAEARVRGFSGYLTELLVIKYGGFVEVLRNAARWRIPVKLSMSGEDAGRFREPMVFVDPTDIRRNVASAVSEESLATFILASREFLRRPSALFFFPPEDEVDEEALLRTMERRGTCVFALSLPAPDIHPDTLHDQARRLLNLTVDIADREGFGVVDADLHIGERIVVLVEVEMCEVPRVKVHRGPPADHPNSEDFMDKWSRERRLRGPYIKGRRLYVDVVRQETLFPRVLLQSLMAQDIGKNLNVLKGEMVCEPVSGENVGLYRDALSRFLLRRLPWLPREGGVDEDRPHPEPSQEK